MLLKILRMVLADILHFTFPVFGICSKKFFWPEKRIFVLLELLLKLQSPQADEGLIEVTVENEGQK